MKKGINGYSLTRKWFDFCFENPDLIKPVHTALYLYILDAWNRFGQKEKFGLPALHTMEVIGIKSKKTYYKTFYDLVKFDFIVVIQKSINQNTANIISLSAVVKNDSAHTLAHTSALDSALTLADTSAGEHTKTIKQVNQETIKPKPFIVGNEKDREHFSPVPKLKEYQEYYFSYATNKYKTSFPVSRTKCDSLSENDFVYWSSVDWMRGKGKNKGIMKSITKTIENKVREQNTKLKDWTVENTQEHPPPKSTGMICKEYARKKDWVGLAKALPREYPNGVYPDQQKFLLSTLAGEREER